MFVVLSVVGVVMNCRVLVVLSMGSVENSGVLVIMFNVKLSCWLLFFFGLVVICVV